VSHEFPSLANFTRTCLLQGSAFSDSTVNLARCKIARRHAIDEVEAASRVVAYSNG
jgi:hypothetical protein